MTIPTLVETSNKPLVTVLMAAHNEEAYVRGAVESILHQSFQQFELIVIDDASTDETAHILAGYRDSRMRVFRNETCQGLTKSLIKGMQEARGAFVARLDADDLAMPQRLEKQLAAFRKAPELGIVGSNCWVIDASGKRVGSRRVPLTDLAIRWRSLIDTPFFHPAVMFRAEVYKRAGGYDPSLQTAQDYDLWTRMLRFTQARNLSRRLIAYRVRQGSVSDKRRTQQLANHDRISQHTLTELMPGHVIPPERHQLLRALYAGGPPTVPPGEIASLVMEYWSLLQEFYASHAGQPGWGTLLMQEWMRNAYRLQRAPWEKETRKAWRMISAPHLAALRH